MALRDERARMATATDRGIAQGLAEGREEGRVEKALFIAKALKAEGVPTETIKRCTGLSEAEIQAL